LALRQWLLLLQGTAIEHEVRLRLEARAVQPVALRASRAADQGRLGWDTFLCSRPSPIDRNDIAYDARIP
jgi:type VI secretion system protein ImpH